MAPTKTVKKPTKVVKPVKKSPVKPVKKSPVKKAATKPVKKSPAKKAATKPVKKSPAKKAATKSTKSEPKRKSLSSLFSGTAASGECNAGFSRGRFGKCEPLPCFDTSGGIINGISRGPDGGCALTECGRGTVIDPSTGKCIGVNTQLGKSLLPYLYETKARVARAKADRFSSLAPYASEGHSGMYKALSVRRTDQRDLATKADESARRIRSERRARQMQKIEERAAYLRARMV